MKTFKEYLIEGAYPKNKVGKEPSFKNKDKQKIADRLQSFIKLNRNMVNDIHYAGSGKEVATFGNNNLTTVKVTDKSTLKKIATFMSIFDVDVKDSTVKVKNSSGKFLFTFSSGRGFFFSDEGKVTTPSTALQETGTIRFLEYNQIHRKYPTHNEINDIVGFQFDDKWYKNFKHQADAIRGSINITSKYAIELDSDSKSIGAQIFKMLKRKFSFTDSKDNWNPADIWIYNSSKKSSILSELDITMSLNDFNAKMSEMFYADILYGVSLKKVTASKAKVSVVDIAKVEPFNLKFASTLYNVKNTYWDIQTTGYPERFMIRARAKAKSIAKKGDIKIYFEGKLKNSTEFLGAIPTKKYKYDGSDTTTFPITKDLILDMVKKVESFGYMKVDLTSGLDNFDDLKMTYIYVMLRYAYNIYKNGLKELNNLAMAGYKLNDYSSIHLKVGG